LQRYQPGTALVVWFRERVGLTACRVRKIMVTLAVPGDK